MPDKKTVTFEGFEVIDRVAKPVGNGGYVSVPRTWIGKACAVVLLEEKDDSLDGRVTRKKEG